MITAILSLELIRGPFPIVVECLGGLALLALLVGRRPARWLPVAALAAGAGAGIGYAVCWLVSDVVDVFGVSLSPASRAWFSAAAAAVAVAAARTIVLRGRGIVTGVASVVVFVLAAALGINADLGEFPQVKNVLGISGYGDIRLPVVEAAGSGPSGWVAPKGMPAQGRIGMVTIPAPISGFRARAALVYLPPAALAANAPKLPVVEMFSGQPGGPEQMFTAGQLGESLNVYAHAHRGLAPIVVVPDQLGAPNHNPMCVNSPLGNSATYLTVDVPRWIRTHLNVLRGREDWAVGGFSQGGTCAIQFGAGHPRVFGNIVDISGQIAPRSGDLRHTVDSGFAGSMSRYEAATPKRMLQEHAPYQDTLGLFAVGQLDSRFAPGVTAVAGYAARAGMSTRLFLSPGTAHDWHTVHFAVDRSLALLGAKWGFDD
ncbi:MAG TPA: alpha/beta hydrolase-fold protein [Lacisediminihabitans sp.]|uniref:alpha/beta hydrolase n=1 Tax=Lacisediminihabitans sp. TaxID=2787631 RepID=UPI002ED9E697